MIDVKVLINHKIHHFFIETDQSCVFDKAVNKTVAKLEDERVSNIQW